MTDKMTVAIAAGGTAGLGGLVHGGELRNANTGEYTILRSFCT